MASLQDTNYEKLVDRLLEQIMRGELRKGQKLPTERQMAEDMNVSRTSIREALKSLGAMGITYSIQGSGTYITDHPENTINKALCALFALSDGTLDNILQLRILLETDSPYLSPVPNRGKRNDSRNLVHIARTLAQWKNMDPGELARIAAENGRRLFRIGENI